MRWRYKMEFNRKIVVEDEMLDVILNTVQCGVIVSNISNMHEFFVNRELLEIFKDINRDTIGKSLNLVRFEDIHKFNLYTTDGQKLDHENFPPLKSIKGEKTIDLELVTKNEILNEEKTVLINSSPFYNEFGDISGSITSILDTTQFKKNEKDLTRLIKGRKLISEEFNNRLSNILFAMTHLLQVNDSIDQEHSAARNKLNTGLIRYIHEVLSIYEDVEYIDFGEYMQILSYELYLLNYNELIALEFEGSAPITLDMVLICGIIVNDIIAYRLSSLGINEENKILIRFNSNNGQITLKIIDDGPKMPTWAEYENNILKLAPELLEQLGGFIKIDTSDQQTSFLVEILYLEI